MRVQLLVGVALLAALPASAAPRIVLHPLVAFGGDPRAVDQSRIAYQVEAARQAIELVSGAQVDELLAREQGATCVDHEGCLERLAKETKTPYALIATIALDGPNFVLGAKVVALDGTFVKSIEALSVPKDLLAPRAPQVAAAFKQLFAQLALGALPAVYKPAAVVEKAPVAEKIVPEPAPAAAVEEPVLTVRGSGAPPLRVGGFVLGGAAVVAAGIGLGVAISASADADELRAHGIVEGSGGVVKPGWGQRAADLDSKVTLATGLLVGAGGAAAISVTMLVLSIDFGDSTVAFAPVQGGAVVGLTGRF
jgi:hypothetical protein